ncbi:MAG: hypothetical protein Fur0028_12720 [Bacteroidales bacterium]
MVYYEFYTRIEEAIACEKQIKGWKRKWKDELISKKKTDWNDLSSEIENW